MGASTGGPQALATVLRALPAPFPWPIVIVQHIDPAFAPGLCEWLSLQTGHRVRAADDGAPPGSGRVHLAATADHLIVDASGRMRYTAEPQDAVYRPSVDAFFGSLASAGATPGIAVVLTGMGRDGAAGLASLRSAGWFTVAQDRATSVVWGMPGAAAEIGASAKVLPVESIGPEIVARLPASPGRSRRPG
jgi:two-component system response regulator WspF